jgi:hypothetical protein
MLSRSRLYTKKEPDRDARLFILFAEGEKTERNYFNYFNQISSRIRIEVAPLTDGRNSPGGLFDTATMLIHPNDGTAPKYDLRAGDEVWFIIDTDQWGPAIAQLRTSVSGHPGWHIAQSNPCFEVWLYYHFEDAVPQLAQMEVGGHWKQYMNDVCGGFDCRKHPIFLERAIENSRNNFSGTVGNPGLASTELHVLGTRILPLVKDTLDAALQVAGF